MNITKEQIDDLNAVVRVKVGPADYQASVDKTLKDYQKKVQMPGFRPGKVPAGMVKKMYGKSVLADELNKLLSDELYKYINENKLEVLGNPLPKEDEMQNDLEPGADFEFAYDVALAPNFNLELDGNLKVTEYKVAVDEKLMNNYISDITRRYGNITQADTVEEGDLIYGDYVELDETGAIKPGGIFKSSTLFLDKPVKEYHQQLIGKKAEDKVVLKPNEIADTPDDLVQKLGITRAEADTLNVNLQFTIKTISRLHPAELSQDLYDKLFGPGQVNSEEEFRARVAHDLANMFVRDTENRLHNDITSALIEHTNLTLPDAFLKRWLVAANKEPVTMEQVEAEYPVYARQLRWQLIENKLIRDNNIQVTQEDMEQHVKAMLRENYKRYFPDKEPEEEELTTSARNVLKKEDEAKKVIENMYHERLMTLYRMKCSIETKEVSYEEFAGK